MQTFQELLSYFGLDGENEMTPPAYMALASQVANVATKQAGMEGLALGTRAYANRASALGYDIWRELMGALSPYADHAEMLTRADAWIKKRMFKAIGVPEDIDQALCDHHALATLVGKKACMDSEHPVALKQPPSGREIYDALGFHSMQQVHRAWETLCRGMLTRMARHKHADWIATVVDAQVDSVAEDVLIDGASPKLLDGLKAYIGSLRRSLGGEMLEKGYFDERFAKRLMFAERSCGLALESYYGAKRYVMDMTDGVYDNLHVMACADYAAEVGKAVSSCTSPKDHKAMAAMSEEYYATMLKENGLANPYLQHPYVIAMYDRCHLLAGLRDRNTRNSDHSTETVDKAARALMVECLQGLPAKRNAHGRKLKAVQTAHGDLWRALDRMDGEIKQLQARGRLH